MVTSIPVAGKIFDQLNDYCSYSNLSGPMQKHSKERVDTTAQREGKGREGETEVMKKRNTDLS
jgi:hypothetical protein